MTCMHRYRGTAPLALFGLIAAHVAVGAPIAPKGVTYIPATASANSLARTELKSIFSGNRAEFSKLISKGVAKYGKVIAGIFMTMSFNESGRLSNAALAPGFTYVPLRDKDKHRLQAKIVAAETDKQADSLASIFYATYGPSAKITISKLEESDMQFIWFYIGWNISEPIYVVHEKNRKFVFEFGPRGKSLRYLEDLTSPCFRLRVSSHDTPCICQKVIHKGNVYENVFQPKKLCPWNRNNKPAEGKS